MTKKLSVGKAFATIALSGTLLLTMTGCNKQVLDFNKSFNVVVEPNGDSISVVGIKNYNDYSGTQVQFETVDGLRVLSSTHQAQMVNAPSKENLDRYVTSLQDFDDVVMYYDDQILFGKAFNKKLIDLDYVFNKAIILKDESATIVELDTWKDYEDDKVQLRLTDGTCMYAEIDKLKIVYDKNAPEGAIERYAASLVGSEENVIHHGAPTK